MCGSSPNSPTSAGSWTSPIGPLADDTEVEILNLLDDHSRLCVASDAQRVFKAGDVDDCFRHRRHPLRRSSLCAQRQRHGVPGRSRGQRPRGPGGHSGPPRDTVPHSRPYHPQTCGKLGRVHQTLKRWLTTRPRARTLRQLQAQLDTFRSYYNMKPAAPRPWPAYPDPRPTRPGPRPSDRPPWTTPTTASATTRSTPAASSPCDTTAGSTTSASAAATPAPTSSSWSTIRHVRVLTHDGQLLRELQLDPSKDYQPQHQT